MFTLKNKNIKKTLSIEGFKIYLKANRFIFSLEFHRKQKVSFCLFYGEPLEHDDHFWLPFCYGNRVYFFFFLSMVETFFSSLLIQIISHLRTAKIELFYRIQILSIKIFKKIQYSYKALFLYLKCSIINLVH